VDVFDHVAAEQFFRLVAEQGFDAGAGVKEAPCSSTTNRVSAIRSRISPGVGRGGAGMGKA
jgi:hypothetical protein